MLLYEMYNLRMELNLEFGVSVRVFWSVNTLTLTLKGKVSLKLILLHEYCFSHPNILSKDNPHNEYENSGLV